MTSSLRLQYVDIDAPAAGVCAKIAHGIRWSRIPLPLELEHINVWLIDAEDGCVAVDTGIATAAGIDAWRIMEREELATTPLRTVFITHAHPDHIGLAAWLQERHEAAVLMSETTRDTATRMLRGADDIHFEKAAGFFKTNGVGDPAQIQAMFRPERYAKLLSGMPMIERIIADNETLSWGNSEWRTLETNGHAAGHLCLFDAANRILIAGDQVLPQISPNIGLSWVGERNPLASYLASLERLRQLPPDTLVLPSHGIPFYGLHHRIDELRRHHEQHFITLERACVDPKTAMDLLPLLFQRELKGMNMFLALAEALAHLEYLAHLGRMERVTANDMVRYQTAGVSY